MNSFTDTLNRLSGIINSRLNPNIQKVWVQGFNSSSARLVFTIFNTDNEHEMKFIDVKNFRHYRPDGDQENEARLLEGYITQFSKSVLSNTII